ncbi:50S ribosomal protein L29 [Desulfobaculum bizertense]|uniref:Large ribosomal subunit protein uL29 n=1 Tax=Desulfobaculum bizertense DSM 18034 TaxID=1121442 RepID=A0A1T4WFY5_9BACT|nr:50S ribosomal protein L29 [Desulfobaculum bizertense]UIJ36664.1 50S ribosomal protein L29 [Desulfobaculum bizertense]SKA76069.1 large subunit ribosomal protein L29 [Desulfobaculum bizertense DSM 18034]
MTAKELRELSVSELNEKLGEFRQELFNLRIQHATAQLENTQRIPEVKKIIARILTILTEKESGE